MMNTRVKLFQEFIAISSHVRELIIQHTIHHANTRGSNFIVVVRYAIL